MAQWILAIIAVIVVIYNSIVTHVIMRNEIKHLQNDMSEVKDRLNKLFDHFLNKDK